MTTIFQEVILNCRIRGHDGNNGTASLPINCTESTNELNEYRNSEVQWVYVSTTVVMPTIVILMTITSIIAGFRGACCRYSR